jgi:hypothetical protein
LRSKLSTDFKLARAAFSAVIKKVKIFATLLDFFHSSLLFFFSGLAGDGSVRGEIA